MTVELPAVAAFIRQHTHDLRNHLNGLDLEAALLAEMTADPEGLEGVGRLRKQIRGMATDLKTLSARFCAPDAARAPLSARDLFLIWQDQAAALGLDAIAWDTALAEEKIDVDVTAVAEVLRELLLNAKHFTGGTGLAASADRQDDEVEFELCESKPEPLDPSRWGALPFVSTKRGGYGLGLWQAEQTVAASGGKIRRSCLPDGTLVTRVVFPLA